MQRNVLMPTAPHAHMIPPLHSLSGSRLVILLALVMAMAAAPALARSPNYTDSKIFQRVEKHKPEKKLDAQQLYSKAKNGLDEENYQSAIDLYDQLQANYPFTRYATQAQLETAFAYYKTNKPSTALAILERFVREHPRNPNVEYAYYLRGLIQFSQAGKLGSDLFNVDSARREDKFIQEAFRSFDNLIQRFPDSRYAADARQRMIFLKNEMARRQWYIARYYMHRQAWLSANRRARKILKEYQDTKWVKEALKIMQESYEELGMETAA